MQKKYFRDSLAEERKNQLLLHNHDDLYGTVLCSQLLTYISYIPKEPVRLIEHRQPEQPTLILSDTIQGYFPVSLQAEQDHILYSFDSHQLKIAIPLYEGTLYHFYKDYKNYYYLPGEDTAVHKSVGIYVDPAHRQKATAATCYTKKTGLFLPLPKKFTPESVPLFKKERRGGPSFLLLDKQPTLSEDILCGLLSCLFN